MSIKPKFVRLYQLVLNKKEHIYLPRCLIRSIPHLTWQYQRGRICCRSPSPLRRSVKHRICHRSVWLRLVSSSLWRIHLHRNRRGDCRGGAPPAGSHLSISSAIPGGVTRGRRSVTLVIRALSGCVCTICGRVRNSVLVTCRRVRIGQRCRHGHGRRVEVAVSRGRSGCDVGRLDLSRRRGSARRGGG